MADTEPKLCITHAADAEFEDVGRRSLFAYRDLGVREATGGRFDAHVLRTGTGTGERKIPRHVHDLDLQLVYVLAGWVRIWFEGPGEVTLTAGDCYVSPGGVAHEVRGWSDDHEVLELTAPAEFETVETPAG